MSMRKNNRDQYLSARCTSEEKDLITNYIKKSGKSQTEYIVDCCVAPRERKTKELKNCLISKIKIIEQINQINRSLYDYKVTQGEYGIEELERQIEKLGGMM